MSVQVGLNVGPFTIENAVLATLEKWMATYVVAAARRYAAREEGITTDALEAQLRSGEFPFTPLGYSKVADFQDWPINALPHVQIIHPSYSRGKGDQRGIGIKYDVQVATVVGATNYADTRLIRACYEDAVVGALLQHPALGGVANGIDLVGGGAAQLSEISEEDAQTFQGSLGVFEVEALGIIDPRNGPTMPLEPIEGVPPPYPPDPEAVDVDVELEPKPIT